MTHEQTTHTTATETISERGRWIIEAAQKAMA